ncbi:MAG: FAD synthase [Alistipes sp.]|jgi:riboflavin kinase/FMN adenylyltransferase|nr:FAD synthase [Alistipes sp.]
MRVFDDMAALPVFRRPVVTVGSFDGVHRGHRFLLDILRRRAADCGGESVVVTFGDHPRRVLDTGADLRVLTPTAEKAELLSAAGVDNLVVMPFDESVARLSAGEFVRDFLVARLGVHELVVGYNHRLGCGREGDAEVLSGLGERYGFRVFRAPKFEPGCDRSGDHDERISSTAIRNAISRGDTATAERMLGRKL